RAYCYAVAGIPGEMLCELFMLDRPELWPVAEDLRERAAVFGEAMQLVNILKDEALDSGEDRVFLPATVATSEALALARRDLAVAREYVDLLRQPGVHPGVVGFHAITCGLAEAALEVTETNGPGAKMSRRCVADVFRGAGISSDHIHEVAR
ncbi:MAG: squalene/phytoene synthase family protein, partial [Myxococcota bacterium]